MHLQFRIAAATSSLPCIHNHLHNFVTHVRLASTSTSSPPYPFPTHRNPTPHQIFHLPPGASQADIKARCTFGPSTSLPSHSTSKRQTTNSPGHSTPTRQQHKRSQRPCVTHASTPSLEPTISCAANHTPSAQMTTVPSSGGGIASTHSGRHTTDGVQRRRTLRRQ